jgi:hypothetical protein
MPCRSRAAAVAQAERMADALRRHGEPVAVVIAEDGDIPPALNRGGAERVRSRKIMPPIRTGK